jgi:hypothetical protein
LPDVTGRVRAVATAALTAVLLLVLVIPSITQAVAPPNIDRFMAALGAVESHGRYDAVNATSGAIGKYQIMPSNWSAWSLRYLGIANASPTPAHQDTVVRRKLTALYNWLGSWASVAHWWLTGNGDTNPAHWSAFSRVYVNRILGLMGAAGVPLRSSSSPASVRPSVKRAAAVTVFDEASHDVHFSGGWGEAEFAGYNGGQVRYAVAAKTTVSFSFHGSSISWIGPKGPTRGQARIYIDDELIGTVDVYTAHYRPRATIFSKTFDRVGSHTIRIEVIGTPGRQTIALDEFDVGA